MKRWLWITLAVVVLLAGGAKLAMDRAMDDQVRRQRESLQRETEADALEQNARNAVKDLK